MPCAREWRRPLGVKTTETDEPKAHGVNSRRGSSPAWAETRARLGAKSRGQSGDSRRRQNYLKCVTI